MRFSGLLATRLRVIERSRLQTFAACVLPELDALRIGDQAIYSRCPAGQRLGRARSQQVDCSRRVGDANVGGLLAEGESA
jgi:hypothetical protein